MGAKINLSGNLGDDPTFGVTSDNTPYVSFSVYQPHRTRTGGKLPDGRDEYQDTGGFWMTVTWFSRKAEQAGKILKKGVAVHVTGDLRVEHWVDKDSGEMKSAWKVLANQVSIDLMGVDNVVYRKRERSAAPPPPNTNANKQQDEHAVADNQEHPEPTDFSDHDDIPF